MRTHRALLSGGIALLLASAGAAWLLGRDDSKQHASETALASPEPSAAEALTCPMLAGAPQANATKTGCTITGTVRRGGLPTTATVEIRRAGDDPLTEAPVEAQRATGPDGRFEFAGLPAGLFLACAQTAEGARGSTLVSLALAGARRDVGVEVYAAVHSLEVVVTREGGGPQGGTMEVAPLPDLRGEIGGADVHRAAPSEVRTGTIDAGGRGVVSGLAPGPYRVAVLAGTQRLTQMVEVPATEPVRFEVFWPPDAVARVVAARATRVPVPGALVRWWGGAEHAVTVLTDGMGGFSLPKGPGGSPLRVDAPGFAVGIWQDGIPARLLLDRPATVRGRATRATDGRPVSGFLVEVFTGDKPWSDRAEARTITGPDGRYVIAGLRPGEVRIRARGEDGIAAGMADLPAHFSATGFESSVDLDPLAVDVGPGETGTLDLVVVDGATFLGRLTAADGTAVAGALVRAALEESTFWERGEAITDANGEYRISGLLPDRDHEITASVDGARLDSRVRAPPGGGVLRIDFTIPETTSFDVQVVDATTGEGLTALLLMAVPERGETQDAWTGRTGERGRLHIGPIRSGPVAFFAPAWGHGWEVVEGGSYVPAPRGTEPGAPWTVKIARRAPGPAWAGSCGASCGGACGGGSPGESQAPVREPPPRLPLRVRVVDPAGTPVPSSLLRWSQSGAYDGGDAIEVADGVAVILRSPGTAPTWVTIEHARRTDGTPLPLGFVRAGPFESVEDDVRMVLPEETVQSGRVVDAAGRGVAGLKVQMLHPGQHEGRTDREGRFRIGGLGREPMTLSVPVPTRYCTVESIEVTPSSSPIEIRLRDSVSARITAFGPDGAPASGAGVSTGWSVSAKTGSDGVAVLEGLDPQRTYDLKVTERVEPGSVAAEAEIEGWTPHDTTIELRLPRTVHGVVRDPKGNPVALAFVNRLRGEVADGNQLVGDDGAFSFVDQGRGPLRLFASMMRGGGLARSDVVDASTGDEEVVLTIDPGVDLVLEVEGEAGKGRRVAVAADPTARSGPDDWTWYSTNLEGRATFRGLRADREYHVWVPPAEGEDQHAWVAGVRASRSSAPIRIPLQRGGAIRGRFTGVSDWSYAGVTAFHGGISVEARAARDGSFEIHGLPDVEWTIRVHVLAGGRTLKGTAAARVGADVTVELAVEQDR